MKNDQTNLVIPRVFYKPTFASTLEVEITGFTVLSWCNRCNNNGSFSLTIPLGLIDFTPSNQGIILCKYYTPDYPDGFYNVVQYIEKIETVSDQNGMKSMLITGSPRQCTQEDLTDAQANGAFYIWKLDENGVFYKARYDANSPSIIHDIDDSSMIDARHVIDNYGGTEGSVLYTWGTRMTGQPRVEITISTLSANGAVSFPSGFGQTTFEGLPMVPTYQLNNDGTIVDNYAYFYHYTTFEPGASGFELVHHYEQLPLLAYYPSYQAYFRYGQFGFPVTEQSVIGVITTDDTPVLQHGAAQGNEGYLNEVAHTGAWIRSDITSNQTVSSRISVVRRHYHGSPSNVPPATEWEIDLEGLATVSHTFSVREVDVKTQQEYLAEMEAAMPNPSSGVVYNTANTIPPGHESFDFTLKSYGNSPFGQGGASYPTGLDVGDKVHAVHEGLGIEATDIISGVLETIDQNGYNIELELGTIYPLVQRRD